MSMFEPQHQYGCKYAISEWPVGKDLLEVLKDHIMSRDIVYVIPAEYRSKVTWHLIPPVDDAELIENMRPAYICWMYDGRKG